MESSDHNHVQQSWPLFDLKITTPNLEIIVPDDAVIHEIGNASLGNILDPDRLEFFAHPEWTQLKAPEYQQQHIQHYWGNRANWSFDKWTLNVAALHDGKPIGGASLNGVDFQKTRSIETGSWILKDYRGRGFGKELRAGLIVLGFDFISAYLMTSTANKENAPSNAVSKSLGYQENGQTSIHKPCDSIRYLLTRADWKENKPDWADQIKVSGYENCRRMFYSD
jgi:RimJ/RimL family protein N-acetyltransferase